MQHRLGLGLKTMYKNVLDEPLPDNMIELLSQFDDDSDDDCDDDSEIEQEKAGTIHPAQDDDAGLIAETDGNTADRVDD